MIKHMTETQAAYDDSIDAVIFKHEDESRGQPIGPVWIRRGGEKTPAAVDPEGHVAWFTRAKACKGAKTLKLPFFEV